MLTGQDRRNSGVNETAHIIPGICSSLRMAWISYGSVDRLHVWEDFPAARQEALMQLVGYSWDQAGAALELLQGCPALPTWGPDPYRSSTGLALPGSHWGHILIVIQEGGRLAATKQRSCLVSRCDEVTWPLVVCRVRGKWQQLPKCRLSNQLVAAAHFTSCRHASLFCQKTVLQKSSFNDLKPMHIFSLVICRGAKPLIAQEQVLAGQCASCDQLFPRRSLPACPTRTHPPTDRASL